METATASTNTAPGKITIVTIQATDAAGKLHQFGERRWEQVKESGEYKLQNRVVESFAPVNPARVAAATPILAMPARSMLPSPKIPKKSGGCGCGK